MKITGGRGGAGRGGAFLGPRLPEPGLQGEEEGKCGAPCGEGGGLAESLVIIPVAVQELKSLLG